MSETIELANQVGQALRMRDLLVTTAESCTGGGVAMALTEIPGSSQWFECGLVTYSNTSKTSLLNVPTALIARHGAVSEEVAAAMATGAVATTKAHVALSTTGIAGPGGAVPGKPVGTVFFGFATKERVHTEKFLFTGDRQAIRNQAVIHALREFLLFLQDSASHSQS